MKKALMLLTLMLCVSLACGSSVHAGIIPGVDGPTLGGSGDDGDHPWGGDRSPAGIPVTYSTVTANCTVLTGIPVVDVLITMYLEKDTGTTYRMVTSTTAAAAKCARTSAVSSSSFSGRKALK